MLEGPLGSTTKISPFAPTSLPEVPEIPGIRFATAEAGIRYKNRTDLLLAVLPPGTVVAGVTTRSKACTVSDAPERTKANACDREIPSRAHRRIASRSARVRRIFHPKPD